MPTKQAECVDGCKLEFRESVIGYQGPVGRVTLCALDVHALDSLVPGVKDRSSTHLLDSITVVLAIH